MTIAVTTAPTTPTATAPVEGVRTTAVAGRVRLTDLFERMFWTFVAAFTSALVSPPLADAVGVTLSIDALDAAVLAGVSSVVNFVTVVARWRLSVLPDPGAGLGHR